MRTPSWILSVAIAFVAATPAAQAQFPGTDDPWQGRWQQGRPGMPSVNGGFDAFGRRPGIQGVPGISRVPRAQDLIDDPRFDTSALVEPLERANVPQLSPQELQAFMRRPDEVKFTYVAKSNPQLSSKVLSWLQSSEVQSWLQSWHWVLILLMALAYGLSKPFKEQKRVEPRPRGPR